ncbi:HAMP domain-containing sensor histidine kinase [Tessaracoccus antarcticus]|uniref:histidine kinase n=1 Tax=Tessaracoccus antarcticus TaxID=2479848 RepID=A0A3M0G5C7_9ACTN|nr:HAMP domain-containing sensor histidine kinase [Tessaracoccus antarcticus]RMB57053.1 sensor histidine kinase [Tessaracoccus antarcticus]
MRQGRGSLARRLLVGQTLVVLGMTVSIVVVAALVGPAVFNDHMRRAGHGGQPDVLEHAQEAFYSAGLQSIGVGLLVAAAGALLVSLVTTRRLGKWLDALSRGAVRVSAGRYDQPVQLAGSSPELERVADAFNGMAAQIQTTEARRRTLLTDVAHELRTPIATIDVTLEALEDGVLAPGPDTYATLRAQSARLARLASDIRDVSAAEEGRLRLSTEVTSIWDVVEASASQWRQRFEEAGVTLIHTAGPDIALHADRARIGQAMDNLLANALRHTPAGGHVEIRSSHSRGHVAIEVVDDGEGIAPEALPHVMERFYRADPARPRTDGSGTGVGLAIAHAVARAHDGDLQAASQGPGRGATFTLSLPSSPNLHRS